MNGNSHSDKRQVEHGGQPLLGVLLLAMSVCVPFLVLIRQSGRVVDALPLSDWSAISPFGTVSVAFVHVVATLALSWTVARTIRPHFGHATLLNVGIFAIVAGGLAIATLNAGDAVAAELIAQASAGPRFLLRLLWTFILQVPWCVSAAVLLKAPVEPRSHVPGANEMAVAWMPILLVAMLVAWFLPMTHANHVTRREIGRAEEYLSLSKQQYRLAWNHLVALESLAGTQQVSQRQSDELRDHLLKQLILLLRQVNQPLAEDAPVEAVIERAKQYVSLNALSDAVTVLEGVPNRRPDALFLLARVHEERRDSQSAISTLEEAANLITDDTGPDAEVGRQIYKGLANNLRRAGRYQEAEERLREALQRFPNSQGFFLFELGLHNQMGGRFKAALDYYESAAEMDPRYRRQVAAAIGQLKVKTPACILRPTKLATR
jgi:hypothetical protein